MVHCTCDKNLGPLPVKEEDLPVELPMVEVSYPHAAALCSPHLSPR
jgi:hypothetical protein